MYKYKHQGFIVDEIDKMNMKNEVIDNSDLMIPESDRSREIVHPDVHLPNQNKNYDKNLKFTLIDIPENIQTKLVYYGGNNRDIILDGRDTQNVSVISNRELNESYLSIKNQQSLSYHQKANLSTEDYSYQTYYPKKENRIASTTNRTYEDPSMLFNKVTDESQLEEIDEGHTLSKYFAQDSQDKLYKLNQASSNIISNEQKRTAATAFYIKKRMLIDRKERIDEIKGFKEMNKSMLTLFAQKNKNDLSMRVRKAREIKTIMKREQTEEKERNLRILTFLNKKEKYKNREIKTQQIAQRKNKNFINKSMVQRSIHRNLVKKEQRNFINNFTQAKNIIEKQMFKGKLIKERRNVENENKIRKQATIQTKTYLSHQAIPSKVFDTAISQPTMFNSFMDEDMGNTYSTTINRENVNQDNVTLEAPSTTYGRNFNEFSRFGGQGPMDYRHKSQVGKRTGRFENQTFTNSIKHSRHAIRKQVFRKESAVSKPHTATNISSIERIRMRNLNRVKNIVQNNIDETRDSHMNLKSRHL